MNKQLSTLEENTLFTLEDDFQIVVEPAVGITALSQTVFERFYRDIEFLKDRAAVCVQGFSTSGVLTDPVQIKFMIAHCRDHVLDLHRLVLFTNRVFFRKRSTLQTSNGTPRSQTWTLSFSMRTVGSWYPPSPVPLLLRLLDEDYAKGPLTGTLIEVTAKRPAEVASTGQKREATGQQSPDRACSRRGPTRKGSTDKHTRPARSLRDCGACRSTVPRPRTRRSLDTIDSDEADQNRLLRQLRPPRARLPIPQIVSAAANLPHGESVLLLVGYEGKTQHDLITALAETAVTSLVNGKPDQSQARFLQA